MNYLQCGNEILVMMVSIKYQDVGDIYGYVDSPLAPETRKVIGN